VFEGGGDQIANFSASMGVHDANEALAQAVKAGQPKGSCIYFAYDLDPPVQSFTNNIGPYATQAATLVRAAGYKVGAYGAGATLSYLFAKGLIDYDWVGGAMGWQGSRGYKRADGSLPSLIQGLPTNMGIIGDVDPDTAFRDAGLFILS
jgi:hypothetical protein